MSGLCRKKKQEKITWQTEFDGVLSAQVCGKLIVELLKFIAFQRNQLPALFDELNDALEKQKNDRPTEAKENDVKGGKKPPLHQRKKDQAIQQLDEIIRNVEQTFKSVPSIENVLVLLGSTPVSPKESFLIKLPRPGFYDGRLLSANSCKREVFRKLVAFDLFSDVKEPSATNVMVFIQAPRDCGVKWFQPKFSFKIPTRGQLFELTISSTCKPSNPEVTHNSMCDFEISGIEPLEKTQDFSLAENLEKMDLSDSEIIDVHEEEEKDGLEESLIDGAAPCPQDAELIWYQAPISMKGFRLKSKKLGLADNIWG